jgi:propanol-preferring alcohol dehydrogenase
MRAYRLLAWKTTPHYQEVPVPDPQAGQVLVKVGGAGICHSDIGVIHDIDEGAMRATLPFTLGHENAGWVEALGQGARGLEVGQPVAVYGPYGCGSCSHCRTGEENLCERVDELPGAGWGLGLDGGLAPYMLVDSARQLLPLGDLDPVLAAPLTDAGITPFRAIRRSLPHLGPGSRAVVIGVGGLGHLAVQILAAMTPALVIAVDTRPEALALASSLGATYTVAAREGAAAEVRDVTGGLGADVVLDLVGTEDTLQLALTSARAGGQIVVAGVGGGVVPWHMWAARYEVGLTSSLGGSIGDLRDVIALAADGHVRPEVTTFEFDAIPDAFGALESGALRGRAVVLPNG